MCKAHATLKTVQQLNDNAHALSHTHIHTYTHTHMPQALLAGVNGVMHFFGRLSFLVDENAHAVHFFISALLQVRMCVYLVGNVRACDLLFISFTVSQTTPSISI